MTIVGRRSLRLAGAGWLVGVQNAFRQDQESASSPPRGETGGLVALPQSQTRQGVDIHPGILAGPACPATTHLALPAKNDRLQGENPCVRTAQERAEGLLAYRSRPRTNPGLLEA